ncbi:M23 family metallopeptidase [Arthrobacter sp. 35W]|uniref:M23 family metallopeptidase n=1 Tax=Arthrobacter sp. 35W TaxID=1132441 RepID=UPI000402584F|nr:M23 family metallopeptidase [Arthrobacter sp. 35W]
MSIEKQHGRRRAGGPSAAATSVLEAAPALQVALPSRRDAIRAEQRTRHSGLGGAVRQLSDLATAAGAGQKVGLALAVTGLALAVTVPSTSPAMANGEESLVPMQTSVVSADASASVSFARPSVGSDLDADGKLHQTLAATAAKVTPEAAKGVLAAPLDTLTPTSGFGQRINPLTGQLGENHTGQDYAATCGTAVHAAAGGTVTFAGWHQYGGGNRVVVDHGNGLSTSYNHLSSIEVKVGQKLERGDRLALSGTTGASTGCHLHFEVMVNDKTVDPLGWL